MTRDQLLPLALASVFLANPSLPLSAAEDNSGATNQVEAVPPVVVTGTRIPTPPENTSSPVTVITRDEIIESQQRFVADVLRDEPGVDVARTGQPGSLTSVFLRGANNSHTLVLIDGIRVNNAFNNAFDFSGLGVDNIDRIEVLRGPQSTLYGSEALGGVINIVTRQGEGKPSGSLETEYGSFNTWLTRGSFAAREGQAAVAAEGSFAASDGDRLNSDYQNANFSGRAGYDFSDRFRASLLSTYSHANVGSPNDFFTNDPNDRMRNESWLLGLTLDAQPAAGWDARIILSHDRERGSFDQPPPNPPYFSGPYGSQTIAQRNQVDFQNIITPAEHHKLLVGGTFEDAAANYADNYSALDRTIDTRSAYLQYELSPSERVTLTAGGRVDNSDAFGTHGTYRFGGRYTAPGIGTIFRANAGTGFRAPSISQLYYPVYGNPHLRPERSFGWDAGLEQPLASARLRLGATFFHNDFNALISGFPPINVDRARTYGLETFATWSPATNVTVRAAYTWLQAEDRATGLRLDRRPEHHASLNLHWAINPQLAASATALLVSRRPDSNYSAFPVERVILPGYTKLDLGLDYRLSKHFSVYGRVENLLDQTYEDVFGFPALGRFFGGGVVARF